ncbi:DUF2332 domain-containing protein [Nonomuraea typhae]|uniref:DUF2332 domain-containing protein n=1 Tax=Nonomuraea typhae TaxID=2603600 RepID=UPI0012FA0E6B|nr:DUF2332 domain-containing protein [Nonomuraea typhae]
MSESTTAERYLRFGRIAAQGSSPSYAARCEEIAKNPDFLALLDALPEPKRQPNLLFGAVRFLDGPVDESFLPWTTAHWPGVTAVMLARSTQTNEAGRCATLMPLLARLPQPLALIEVGASAGLCLFPDKYRYAYNGQPSFGPDSPVVLPCRTNAVIPRQLPQVAWRAGIDLNPVDLADPEQRRWLEALVWPEQGDRLARLRAAIEIVRADPPRIVRGDLNDTVEDLVAQAPEGATTVVFHSAVLAYLTAADRRRFTGTMRRLPVRWISNEAPAVIDGKRFALLLDGEPVARTGSHGQLLEWI